MRARPSRPPQFPGVPALTPTPGADAGRSDPALATGAPTTAAVGRATQPGKSCADHIGKPPHMNACLRENKSKLSDSCRKVVESRGG
ncbi:hypothetical protein [Bradyrhizobium sp. 199]|uniref:hypothetical protein n=1 Tax=Bradyrhizobium sp. 199 TaxID=2782664 RepID=UPI001FF76CB7|nr:hypothetical protein [Bradyrhizobium sp. 199]MCK1361478.1 hypothetical protein [Bradyrhizobium sp. 199]